MKWLFSRTQRSPIAIEPAPTAIPVARGIDHLLAQAGRAPSTPPVETISLDVLQKQSDEARARSDWAEAERLLTSMRESFPDVSDGYTAGAVAACGLGRYEQAGTLLAEAAVRFPLDRAIPLARGRLAAGLSDWRAAETHWRTALAFDVRPWWVYTELAGALEHAGRVLEAEAVLLEGQARSDEPDEITLFTYPARLAWQREDWALAVTRWAEARRRFPQDEDLPAREYEALLRLGEHDPEAYAAALRALGRLSPDEERREMVLRFESLGGNGPDGGCEFGCFQRRHGAEPLGLFRWATVTPAQLIACLNGRFAGIGEMDAITIAPHEGQWEITDTAYGTRMHSFVSVLDTPAGRMMVSASRRMRYLRDKLIGDLRDPEKIFVLKVAWEPLTAGEIEALSRAIRSYGPASLLCVCAADDDHQEGSIHAAAPGVFVGYLDVSGRLAVADRHGAWEALCRAMLAT